MTTCASIVLVAAQSKGGSEPKAKSGLCDAEYERLSAIQKRGLKAIGAVAIDPRWSLGKLREALKSPGKMQVSSASNEVSGGWYEGPTTNGLDRCRQSNDVGQLGLSEAVWASFVTSSRSNLSVPDDVLPRVLTVSVPFPGTVDGISVGVSVADFQSNLAKLGWSRANSDTAQRTMKKGSWQLDWTERNGIVRRIMFTDSRYMTIPK